MNEPWNSLHKWISHYSLVSYHYQDPLLIVVVQIIFRSIKIVPAISKVHFYSIPNLISLFLILILISIKQPSLVAKKPLFHLHQMRSNLFASTAFIFLLSLKQKNTRLLYSIFISLWTCRVSSHVSKPCAVLQILQVLLILDVDYLF